MSCSPSPAQIEIVLLDRHLIFIDNVGSTFPTMSSLAVTEIESKSNDQTLLDALDGHSTRTTLSSQYQAMADALAIFSYPSIEPHWSRMIASMHPFEVCCTNSHTTKGWFTFSTLVLILINSLVKSKPWMWRLSNWIDQYNLKYSLLSQRYRNIEPAFLWTLDFLTRPLLTLDLLPRPLLKLKKRV